MKILFAAAALMFICATAAADQEAYVFTDYAPARIMYLSPGANVEVEASKAGLSGAHKLIKASEIPQDRSDRNAWKFKGGRIEVDAKLKKELSDKKQAQESKKLKLVERLKSAGLDDEDISTLGVKI